MSLGLSWGFADWIVLLVAVQRLCELAYSRRNAQRLIAEGGYEVGAGHYPVLIAIHVGWLVAMSLLIPADAPIFWWLLALYAFLQVARYWVIGSLGRYWTTRIITLPTAPLVTRGPYRYVRHPNYLVLVGELAVLPLAFGAWEIALVFSVLNAGILWHRIRIEEQALDPRAAE
ncbi:MAG: isoprenylcysteine carboxylmethyltransferase family protein [Alphaproteobacteria bacterium]|nr:isoprenylcysteine carboxylmethyltransferase family protein [Alphaproteobacteria bacterium]